MDFNSHLGNENRPILAETEEKMSGWLYFPEVDERMDASFMERLVFLREEFDQPMPVTSSYRTQESELQKGRTGNSAHCFGRAVDVAIQGEAALRLIALAYQRGFTGIGIKQHGINRFIHLDDMGDSDTRPRPWLWSYS